MDFVVFIYSSYNSLYTSLYGRVIPVDYMSVYAQFYNVVYCSWNWTTLTFTHSSPSYIYIYKHHWMWWTCFRSVMRACVCIYMLCAYLYSYVCVCGSKSGCPERWTVYIGASCPCGLSPIDAPATFTISTAHTGGVYLIPLWDLTVLQWTSLSVPDYYLFYFTLSQSLCLYQLSPMYVP